MITALSRCGIIETEIKSKMQTVKQFLAAVTLLTIRRLAPRLGPWRIRNQSEKTTSLQSRWQQVSSSLYDRS